jgi:hypothetical protein
MQPWEVWQMVATKQSKRAKSKDDFGVRIADRSYPVHQRGGQKPPTRISPDGTRAEAGQQTVVADRTKREPRPTEKVAIDLFDKIWGKLALAGKSAADFQESEQVARCFVASHEQLSKLAEEARSLLEALCRYHVQTVHDSRVSSERRQQAEEAKVRECMDVAMPKVWLGPELDVKTLAQRPEVAFAQLQNSLRRNTVELVESLFSALEQLVDKGVVGLIEWHSASLCKFHFFRRLLIHDFEGQTTDERTKEFWHTIDGSEMVRTETTKRTSTKGREIHEHIRHEQQLMKASARSLDAPDLVIPQDIEQLVGAIPAWLSPFMRVAVGECFRERIIRQIEKDEQWEDTKVDRHVFERPVVYFDPAICIGEFVLVGWGQRDHDNELRRRAALDEANTNRTKALDALGIAGIVFLVGFALVLGSMSNFRSLLWLGWATMAASLWPFNVATFRYVRSRGGQLTPNLFVASNLAILLAGLSVVFGILAVFLGGWLPVLLAVLMLAVLVPVGFSTLQALRGVDSSSADE